jgi:Putative lumazine-binding
MINNKNVSFCSFELSNLQKLLFVLVLTVGVVSDTKSQHDTVQIKNTIARMFDGMASFDSSMVRQTLADGCHLKSIIQLKNGEISIVEETTSAFINMVGTKKTGLTFDEKILSYRILIDGAMAVAWTPYRFYINELFSHCGVNVFTLVKKQAEWKILNITDTRRKSGCKE